MTAETIAGWGTGSLTTAGAAVGGVTASGIRTGVATTVGTGGGAATCAAGATIVGALDRTAIHVPLATRRPSAMPPPT